jgi:flagellum-specific ATP synthase
VLELSKKIKKIKRIALVGHVSSVVGMRIEVIGITPFLGIGSRCQIISRQGEKILCEVIGFLSEGRALVLPYTTVEGIGTGCPVEAWDAEPVIYPHSSWKGRVLNAFSHPIDGKEDLIQGSSAYHLHQTPPPAYGRQRIGPKVDLGIRAINTFLSCCIGQRMGIFAGSGVGKSLLLAMMARLSQFHVIVIGLVGERGREVQEFIDDYLGPEGLKKSVLVVATSDESPLMRKQAAQLTLTIAEYFADQGLHVMCMIDSVTRFAMAQREIGLTLGEPPTTRGYTPTVFSEIPKLLERAGPRMETGSITGLFTVLVEGDDQNEPIADAVRGTLDGHIILDRSIAMRRLPAIDILRSVSRTMPACNTPQETELVNKAKEFMMIYEDMADLIRLGAYRKGTDPQVDQAIHYAPLFHEFLSQMPHESSDLQEGFEALKSILETYPSS